MEICCWEFLWKYFLFKVNKVSDAIVCTRARRMWPGSLLSRTYNRPLSSELVVLLLSRVVVGISNLGSLTPEWAAVFSGNPKTSFHVVGWWVLNWWILPGFFVGSGSLEPVSPWEGTSLEFPDWRIALVAFPHIGEDSGETRPASEGSGVTWAAKLLWCTAVLGVKEVRIFFLSTTPKHEVACQSLVGKVYWN